MCILRHMTSCKSGLPSVQKQYQLCGDCMAHTWPTHGTHMAHTWCCCFDLPLSGGQHSSSTAQTCLYVLLPLHAAEKQAVCILYFVFFARLKVYHCCKSGFETARHYGKLARAQQSACKLLLTSVYLFLGPCQKHSSPLQ